VVSASAAKSMEKLEAARQGLVARRAAVDQEINRLAAKAGVDPDDIAAAVRALRAQNRHADARALQRLDDEYEALGLKLVKKSEELGMVAARDFAQSRGAVPLYEGPPGTPGTLDLVHHNPGPPVVLFVCEAKGGSSVLGTRNIGGVRYQQGTATYLRWMLANDAGFRAAAQRQGLLRLIEEGTITVEYHLVRAPGGQRVLINQFDIVAP
jgi:hypothetical protein